MTEVSTLMKPQALSTQVSIETWNIACDVLGSWDARCLNASRLQPGGFVASRQRVKLEKRCWMTPQSPLPLKAE